MGVLQKLLSSHSTGLVAIIFCLVSTVTLGQISPVKPAIKANYTSFYKVYQLNKEQYKVLIEKQSIADSLEVLTNFIKNVPTTQYNFADSLPYGHYVGVRASGTQINFRLHSHSYFKMQSHGYNGEVWHILTDQEGNVIKEASLSIENKEYKYTEDCNCYPVPATTGNDTILVTYEDHYSYFKSSSQIKPQADYKVETNQYPKQRFSDIRILPGYVAFNQPMYRKNDTIKVKAFLVNEKGKVWKKRKVKVKYTTPEQKTVLVGKIKRQSEGAYVTEFVVPESFSLGNYKLSFWTSWDEVKLRSEMFKILDYELQPANTYEANSTQELFYNGQNVDFILKARDVNELPLLDAKAKLTIEAIRLSDFYSKLFYWNGKPDYFKFEKETIFDVAGETVVSFPDSLFPNASMNYRATIEYRNDLGKLFSKAINFTFDAKKNHFEFELKGDSIAVDYFTFDQNTAYDDLSLLSMRGSDTVELKTIQAPFREKIDLFNTLYVLKDKNGKEIGRVNLQQNNKLPIKLIGKRTHDSIQIQLVNDLQMPVSYQIFKRDKKVDGGEWTKGESALIFNEQDASLDDYHVIYSVFWREKHFVKEQIFYSDETKLNVAINQPDIVFPGSNVLVEVNVTDYKNKGVEGANITAYSVNDLFPDIPLPKLPYFGRLHKGFLTHFQVSQQPFTINKNIQLTEAHLDKFNLREVPYYGFIYAKNGVGLYRDSISSDLAELAVYASHINTDKVRIYAVYLNEEPVAINGSSNYGKYVFAKPAGTYEVKIRTSQYLYTIKKVSITKGERTYLCLNEFFSEGNPDVSYLKIEDKPFKKEEWAYLQPNFLYLAKNYEKYVLEQNGLVVTNNQVNNSSRFYASNNEYTFIGPFKEGKVNVYNQSRDSIMSFDFYPGYLYYFDTTGQIVVGRPVPKELTAQRYNSNSQNSDWSFIHAVPNWKDFLPQNNPKPEKKDIVEVKKAKKLDINYDNPARFQQLKSFNPALFGKANSGGISLKNNSGKTIYWVLCNSKEDPVMTGAWYTSQFNYHGFHPGLYDIMVLYTDSSYSLIPDFSVREKGTNFYRIDSNEVNAPDMVKQTYYEEIIVEANKSPVNRFVNYPLYFQKINLKTVKNESGKTMISGYLLNTYGKPVNRLNIIFEIDGKFKYGALTNRDGYFELKTVDAGQYNIKVGNSLPYRVYEGFNVEKGMNNRIVIGNDPALQLNDEGEVEIELNETVSEEVSVYSNSSSNNYSYTNNINATNISSKEIQYAPTMKANADLREVMISTRGVFNSDEKRVNTFNSVEYPNLEFEGDSNKIEAYAKKNKLDKATMDLIRQSDSLNRIRDNFRDYGYWVPNMETDANGNARFTVQFPDNITRWKTIVPAMTGDKQAGIGVKYAQSFKPLSAHLGIPSFLVEGDSIQLEGKVLNYTNDLVSVKTWFTLNADTLQSGMQSTNRVIDEQHWFTYPKPDSLELGYGLKMADGYLDGEQRKLSVLTSGIALVEGEWFMMEKDSALMLRPNGAKKSVYIYNNPLGIYESEINQLKNYRYGCNEQTASKLKALLLEEKIAQALEQPFTGKATIRKCIAILNKNQLSNGTYGWWGRSPYEFWVTVYVLDALNKAAASYKVGDYILTARLLQSNLEKMTVSDRLSTLNTLADIPYPMNYTAQIARLDTVNLSLQDQFKLIYLKQQKGLDVKIDTVLNSYQKSPEGIFWGEALFDTYINVWQTSALAYKIMRNAGGQDELMTKMRDYFLKLNPEGRNTIERSTLLELFLEDELLANQTAEQFKGEVWVNDQQIETFPYFKSFDSTETIQIRKTGKRVNVQVNSHTISKNPTGNDSILTVSTHFNQYGTQTDSLIAGTSVLMTVTVTVKEKMDHVLLEIPIPATCIYNSQKASTNRHEAYREEFRYMTAISCANLPKGKHQFKINLIPRYEGKFKVVPVKVEEMYFPVNANYSKAKTIVVQKP